MPRFAVAVPYTGDCCSKAHTRLVIVESPSFGEAAPIAQEQILDRIAQDRRADDALGEDATEEDYEADAEDGWYWNWDGAEVLAIEEDR